MLWLQELFCPQHGLPVLLMVYRQYWHIWRVGMALHVRIVGRGFVGMFRG